MYGFREAVVQNKKTIVVEMIKGFFDDHSHVCLFLGQKPVFCDFSSKFLRKFARKSGFLPTLYMLEIYSSHR